MAPALHDHGIGTFTHPLDDPIPGLTRRVGAGNARAEFHLGPRVPEGGVRIERGLRGRDLHRADHQRDATERRAANYAPQSAGHQNLPNWRFITAENTVRTFRRLKFSSKFTMREPVNSNDIVSLTSVFPLRLNSYRPLSVNRLELPVEMLRTCPSVSCRRKLTFVRMSLGSFHAGRGPNVFDIPAA